MTIYLDEQCFGADRDIIYPNVQTCVALAATSTGGGLVGMRISTLTSSSELQRAGETMLSLLNGAVNGIVCIGNVKAFSKPQTGLSGMLGRTKDRPYFRINLLSQTKRNPSSPEFNAYYVPMLQTADAAGQSSHFILPGTGPDIALTSRLSGCSFGVGSNSGNATLVSHIQPNLAVEGGRARANDLAHNMQSGFASQRQVVSRGDDYSDLATVIGKRSGTKWVFYLQDYVTVALPSDKIGFEIRNLVVVN